MTYDAKLIHCSSDDDANKAKQLLLYELTLVPEVVFPMGVPCISIVNVYMYVCMYVCMLFKMAVNDFETIITVLLLLMAEISLNVIYVCYHESKGQFYLL